MGFPMIQVFMIAARQVSKPAADLVIRYGKNHPTFRNKILIPIGRSLVHLSTRLRMEKLGLGKPITMQPVSESTALEQASDFVQQVVVFMYSVSVFAGYYFYTAYTAPDTVKGPEFKEFLEQHDTEVQELRRRIIELEGRIGIPQKAIETVPSPSTPSSPLDPPSTPDGAPQPSRPWYQRISSLPIEAAERIIYGGDEYVVCRREHSVSIEQASVVDARGPLTYRKKRLVDPEFPKGPSRVLYQAASYITGWREWEM